MNFRYQKFPVNTENCPFPNKKSSLRPIIEVDFETQLGNLGYLVLIDSGADYCIFHAEIGGHSRRYMVGFSYDMGKLAYGLLGQDGFFDKWNVKFEYQKENIELKEFVGR